MPFVFGKPSEPGDAAAVRRVSSWMRLLPSGAAARGSNPLALLSRSSLETARRQPGAPTAAALRNSWLLLPPQRDGAARHCQCGSTALWSGPTLLPRPPGGEDWSRCYGRGLAEWTTAAAVWLSCQSLLPLLLLTGGAA